jgi:hypothetical protein
MQIFLGEEDNNGKNSIDFLDIIILSHKHTKRFSHKDT